MASGLLICVFFSTPILTYLNLNNNNNKPTNTPNFFNNQTVYSFSKQTTQPPLSNPSTSLAGGNQYASLRFAMDVSVNGSITNLTQSFQYSNLRFIGTLTNFSGNSLNTNTFTLYNQSSVNYQTNFVLTTSI